MSDLIPRFRDDESGATTIEYALIGALVSVAIIVGATAVGSKLHDMFIAVSTTIPAAP